MVLGWRLEYSEVNKGWHKVWGACELSSEEGEWCQLNKRKTITSLCNYDILEMYIVQDTSLSDSPKKTKDKRKKEENKDIYIWFSINFFRSRTFS